MRIEKHISIPIPSSSLPYNFDFFLTHYVFQPWVVEGNELVRLFKLDSGKYILMKVEFEEKTARLGLRLISDTNLTQLEIIWATKLVKWMFAVDDDVQYFYKTICKNDPILKAASADIYGAHLRTDPTVFESILGVVVAQNVYFGRIYEMTRLLCQKFGESKVFNGKTYYTFPTPQALARAKLADIRSCKVGYRDTYIQGIAKKIVGERLDLDKLRESTDLDFIRKKLIELPGVGPYTAELTIAISFRRPVFHLDLFSREAMYTFYFKGKHVSDTKLMNFVQERWGKYKHYAMLLLTTNTDVWAKRLGIPFRLKSAAKSPA